MKTLLEILRLSEEYLEVRKISNSRRQAEELLCDALGMDRLALYMEYDRPLTESELKICRERLNRRGLGEPLPYIKGDVTFLDCLFSVDQNVLIPRQETEILADMIVKTIEKEPYQGKSFWDVCCGSGCLGIAIKKRLPDLNVILSDISAEALRLAEKNAGVNNVEVIFKQGNLLEPFYGLKVDYLVSNPPYISQKEYDSLDKEVRDFEPKQALLAGESGLEFYDRFSKSLLHYINRPGKVWFEIGKDQGKDVISLFKEIIYSNARIEKDWAGHDRFFFLEMESILSYSF